MSDVPLVQNPIGPVLVIGRTGQVASDLVVGARERGIALTALGRPDIDLARPDDMVRVLEAFRPAALINAAAYTQVDRAESESETVFALNRDAPAIMARFCARHNVPLLHLSTDQVFDGACNRPWREEDFPHPLSVYGQSKWEGEEAVLKACPEALIVRVSWVFGPSGENFLTKLLSWARQKPELAIVSDQIGCPTHSPTLAGHLLTLAALRQQDKGPQGLLHLAGSEAMSRFEQAKLSLAEARRQGFLDGVPENTLKPILTEQFPTPARRPLNAVLDTSKVKDHLGTDCGLFSPAIGKSLKQLSLKQ
jgi:dTDP-4-dehydrorhamnose reductase